MVAGRSERNGKTRASPRSETVGRRFACAAHHSDRAADIIHRAVAGADAARQSAAKRDDLDRLRHAGRSGAAELGHSCFRLAPLPALFGAERRRQLTHLVLSWPRRGAVCVNYAVRGVVTVHCVPSRGAREFDSRQ